MAQIAGGSLIISLNSVYSYSENSIFFNNNAMHGLGGTININDHSTYSYSPNCAFL